MGPRRIFNAGNHILRAFNLNSSRPAIHLNDYRLFSILQFFHHLKLTPSKCDFSKFSRAASDWDLTAWQNSIGPSAAAIGKIIPGLHGF
jgi:hypothetical protein